MKGCERGVKRKKTEDRKKESKKREKRTGTNTVPPASLAFAKSIKMDEHTISKQIESVDLG
jgi:hypothetical protein